MAETEAPAPAAATVAAPEAPVAEAPVAEAPGAAAATEPGTPAHTVPLVPFTPFVAPDAPVVPVAGLDAGQAGLALASAEIGATQGMSGILGQDHLRGDVMPVRFLLPPLTIGPRQRWWLWRAGPALVTGILVAILIGWPMALIAAGLILSAGALFSYRISPAFSPAARASSARRRTRRRLARLGNAGYLALHDRAIPGTDQVIDHLVVGPAGIYAVDSEIWDRRLPVRATRGGKLFHGPRDQAARLDHARWEAGQVARLIGAALGQPITARPAMVIYGPTVPWIVVRISGVDVFCGRRLRKYLRREAAGRSGYLDERQVEAIHDIAAQVLPPAH
jgi:nuclease-like protein